jgi:hypothetical protein
MTRRALHALLEFELQRARRVALVRVEHGLALLVTLELLHEVLQELERILLSRRRELAVVVGDELLEHSRRHGGLLRGQRVSVRSATDTSATAGARAHARTGASGLLDASSASGVAGGACAYVSVTRA